MPQPSWSDVEATWRRLSISPDDFVLAPDGTIRDTAKPAEAPAVLPPSGHQSFELGELVGHGGMGRVHEARQVLLSRRVAVKKPRSELPEAATELVREARITGALEHPNIVPVHTLELDEHGLPAVVMKLLGGQTWGERLAIRRDGADELERELDTLEQVARGIAFAHDRGVIHRDVKPENVMLGNFGEVVLVDWGLALAISNTDVPDVRAAHEVAELAGTVAYMAPEMALADGNALGTATDVYLLGGVLYEILTGRPPHTRPEDGTAPNVRRVLARVFTEPPPPLPDWVPAPLVTICERALARDPADRYPDGEAFRAALADYRRNAESLRMVSAAAQLVARARRHQDLTAPEVGESLSQARFAFEQGLRAGLADPMLQRQLEDVLVLMVRREIAARRHEAASSLLAELSSARPDLHDELADLREQLEDVRARMSLLEHVAAESDLGQAARYRRVVGVAFAIAFFALSIALGTLDRLGIRSIDHAAYLGSTAFLATTFGVPSGLFRERLFPNAANRRLALTLGLVLLGQAATFAAMWSYGIALRPSLTISLVQLTFVLAICSLLLDRRVLWTAVVGIATAVVSALIPSFAVELVGVAYATYFLAGALLSWDRVEPRLLEDVRRKPPE